MSARRWLLSGVGTALLLYAGGAVLAPELLAFPYAAQIGDHRVYAEAPISPEIRAVLATADARRATSPIDAASVGQRIFITQGGWRWRLLTITSSGAFAIARPLSEVIVVNRADIAADRVWNGAAVGGVRPLSAVIAHEMTHGLIRKRYGLIAAQLQPTWKIEGYCDHVAGGGSLSDADAARLEAARVSHPALPYYHGRRRVAATLAANGGSVDRLFADD